MKYFRNEASILKIDTYLKINLKLDSISIICLERTHDKPEK